MKKLTVKFAFLCCLLGGLFYFGNTDTSAAPNECLACRKSCRSQYTACLAGGGDVGWCFANYENCLDYICGPICGG